MANYSIRAENLGKEYRVHRGRRRVMFRQALQDAADTGIKSIRSLGKINNSSKSDNRNRTFWALRDISFELKPGESVGIIGSNGAGKSTLLKILSRVTTPSEGRVRLRGRVGSLLEVGTGFHPELTGRENIYFNGSILGMRRQEIDHKFDQIVSFSEVEDFLETPVKFYSSGMKLRLAFSVAAHLDPDILLVDEILAVGDAAFQKKSLSKMENVVRDGRTVLFVSHNMALVRSLCTKGIFIEDGELKYLGEMEKAIDQYLHRNESQNNNKFVASADPYQSIQIMSVEFYGDNNEANRYPHDQPTTIKIKLAVREDLYRFGVSLSILDKKLSPICTSYDFEMNEEKTPKTLSGIVYIFGNNPSCSGPGTI
jgi:lipopolysaccharide transport system ATP-binding protein